MGQYIVSEGARKGSYRRMDLAADILGGLFAWGEIQAIAVPGHVSGQDGWLNRALRRGLISDEDAQACQKDMEAVLTARGMDLQATYEEIYADVRRAYETRLGARVMDEMAVRDALSDDLPDDDPVASVLRSGAADIDQSNGAGDMLKRAHSALFILSDPRYGALLKRDLRNAQAEGKAVYMAYAPEGSVLLPGYDAIMRICAGLHLARTRCVAVSDDALVDGVDDLSGFCAFCYGGNMLAACRQMAIPALVRAVPVTLMEKALAGQFVKKGLCSVYVPAGFDILPFVPIVRRTLAAYRQIARLSELYGDGVYAMSAQQMYDNWPDAFLSVYDEDLTAKWPIDLPPQTASEHWYPEFCRRRDDAIRNWLDAQPGVRALSGYFDLRTMESAPAPWEKLDEPLPLLLTPKSMADPKSMPWMKEARDGGIMVHGIMTDSVQDAFVERSAGRPLSPRAVIGEAESAPALQVTSNYLFFMTPRLCQLYNRLRTDRPMEQSGMKGGHLDFMLFHEGDRRVETFPLYEKACMGLTGDRKFVFFHFRLRGGRLTVNGQSLTWNAGDVDPVRPGKVAVWTPMLSGEDAGADRMTYTRTVGEGRVNLVVNQEELTCLRDGDVLLPGTGVVVSVERETGLKWINECGFTPKEEGYYDLRGARFDLSLERPDELDEATWQGMVWAYGGGLTLIRDGKPVFEPGIDAGESLRREGWTSPLSAQTQESDIVAMHRHPRTAVGVTKGGSLFILVFNGRSPMSVGANYNEICAICRKMVPDVKELMNVDGGGSSVLGFSVGNRFMEYSWPSTSFDSVVGMVRPVNSTLNVVVAR